MSMTATNLNVAGCETADSQVVLLALMGTSPAVLSETVWALAREKPAFIPDRIVAITTTTGRNAIRELLFESGGWDRLVSVIGRRFDVEGKLKFGLAADSVRCIPDASGRRDLDDISTAQDNNAAADFIMRTVREFTEDPDSKVIASLAGGRKTMSALMMSCMTLLGRAQDKLCHVLVNPPFESAVLEPIFLFPEKGVKHKTAGGKMVSADLARIELIEVPFVRARGWYEKEYRNAPPNYMALVNRFQGLAPVPGNHPEVVMQWDRGIVSVGARSFRPSAMEFALAIVLLERIMKGVPATDWGMVNGDLDRLFEVKNVPVSVDWWHVAAERFKATEFSYKDELRKVASSLRQKVRGLMPGQTMADGLIPIMKKGVFPVAVYPKAKVRIAGRQ